MSNKQDSLLKIQSYMKDNGLNQIILNRAIQTKWTFDQSKDYIIRELRIAKEERITAWQGYGYRFQNTLQYLDEFDEYTISQVERELEQTISMLKTFRVKVTSYVDVRATKPEYAKEYVDLHPIEAKENLLWIESTNDVRELENQ